MRRALAGGQVLRALRALVPVLAGTVLPGLPPAPSKKEGKGRKKSARRPHHQARRCPILLASTGPLGLPPAPARRERRAVLWPRAQRKGGLGLTDSSSLCPGRYNDGFNQNRTFKGKTKHQVPELSFSLAPQCPGPSEPPFAPGLPLPRLPGTESSEPGAAATGS